MKEISVCTVCMGRLNHLRQTLPQNILDNYSEDVEFVVLDYNSSDGLEDYMKSEHGPLINAGVVKYYKTTDPQYFDLSHSKNIVVKLAEGKIICLVDADNYAGQGYVNWIRQVYAEQGPDRIITTIRKDDIPYRDQGGKLAFTKELFMKVNGFDESLTGYGMDDVDLVNRMEKAGGVRHFIEQEPFLQYIWHSHEDRLKNFHLLRNVDRLLVLMRENYNDNICPVLYFLNDNSFIHVNYEYRHALKDDVINSFMGWTIGDDGVKRGRYTVTTAGFELFYAGTSAKGRAAKPKGQRLCPMLLGEKLGWKQIAKSDESFIPLILAFGECYNRRQFEENNSQHVKVNEKQWGSARVYKNFDEGNMLNI